MTTTSIVPYSKSNELNEDMKLGNSSRVTKESIPSVVPGAQHNISFMSQGVQNNNKSLISSDKSQTR